MPAKWKSRTANDYNGSSSQSRFLREYARRIILASQPTPQALTRNPTPSSKPSSVLREEVPTKQNERASRHLPRPVSGR